MASTLQTNTIEPQSGTDLTVGTSGTNTVLAGNVIKSNVLKDAGGNAILTSDGSGNLSGVNSAFGASTVLLSTQTVTSSTTTVTFSSSLITSDYNHYIFKFYNVQTAGNAGGADFAFNVSTDNGSTYAVTKTSTVFRSWHSNADTTGLAYNTGKDLWNSTDNQKVMIAMETAANVASAAGDGELHLFSVSNTSVWKQFYATSQQRQNGDYSEVMYTGGSCETASAINCVKFEMDGSTISKAIIKLYGIK